MIVTIVFAGIVLARAIAAMVRARFFTRQPLFFPAGQCIGVYPEIMIGKLMIIFGLDAVAIDLRVLRHFFEFIEHLCSIAPRAAVDPVIAIRSATAIALGAVTGVPAPSTAARLTIVHQMKGILIPLINLVFLKL